VDIFYWVLIGVLVALVAKVQIPTDGEENVLVLLAAAIMGSVVIGLAVKAFGGSGALGAAWVSHVAAFIGAVGVVLGLRVATRQHLA
jgi:uncharacterized membrane protein YeaQ/YmgE (transglycosylase-associated protein family)